MTNNMSVEPLPPDALALVENPEAQLARITEVRDVVLGQSDFPGTYREYARLTGLGAALKQYQETTGTARWEIALICREAERKMGQMLLDIPRHPGARTDLTSSGNQIRLYSEVIEELGIDHNRAHSWQQAAQCPEDGFLALVEDCRRWGRFVTLEGVIGWPGDVRPVKMSSRQPRKPGAGVWKKSCPGLRNWPNRYPLLRSSSNVWKRK